MSNVKYSEFAHRLDVEAWEDAIGFEVKFEKTNKVGQVEAVGHCLDPWGQHSHGDTTGKLAINRDERLFNCWVCGGGTLLSYTMALKDMDIEAATDWLYQFTRVIDETKEEFLDDIDRILFEAKAERKAPPYFNLNVLTKWLDAPWQECMFEWMNGRGISREVILGYNVGFNAELTRRSSKGDFTGPAVVFPHWWQGRLVGWQNRWLCEFPKHIPKYVFTNDFPREESIYGFEHVYLADRPVVVVESVPTVLFLASHGYPAVATFGSSITAEQGRWLRRLHQGVIISADNDKAGDKFERDLVALLEPFVNVRVMDRVPGDGADLGDLAELPEAIDVLVHEATIPGF